MAGGWVTFDERGRASATLTGEGNPIAELHARTWGRCIVPAEDDVRRAYLAAGFPADQLERLFRRRAKWRELPEVAAVRFPKPVGSILKQTELMLGVGVMP